MLLLFYAIVKKCRFGRDLCSIVRRVCMSHNCFVPFEDFGQAQESWVWQLTPADLLVVHTQQQHAMASLVSSAEKEVF
jgi:hypothetical protein